MNKQDIAIVILLVALLFGWMHFQNKSNAERARIWEEEQAAIAATNQVDRAVISQEAQATAAFTAASTNQPAIPTAEEAVKPVVLPAEEESDVPEKTVSLKDGEVELVVSSKGGAISSATLFGYRESIEKDSPNIRFDYKDAPILALGGIKGLGARSDFEVVSQSETSCVVRCTTPEGLVLTRDIALLPNYQIVVRETIKNSAKAAIALPERNLSIGSAERLADSKNSIVSVDTLSAASKAKVHHWERKGDLISLFSGRKGGGCSGAPDGSQCPPEVSRRYTDPQQWIALKTRFFALVFTSDAATAPGAGYGISASRSLAAGPLRIDEVKGRFLFPAVEIPSGGELAAEHKIYIGPKKYSILRKFAPQTGEIMEFGWSKWLCVLMLPILNGLNAIFCNYGVAIIILTIIVRLVFWPLTRKSNESMKKMGAIQPKIKELQEKFKDDPQKLQQETMKFYRENNVNPMASCLPMLVQIPVFIALFVVLRSATELRFAEFLWIRDLSEPENLFAGLIPGLPAINLLPFLMAGTMFLQSKLTPSMGDPRQQRMMMWMMPLMMFFMFYSMPSALLLYWTVSQILAIVQLVKQRKDRAKTANAAAVGADGVIEGEVVTRQERRRRERENEEK